MNEENENRAPDEQPEEMPDILKSLFGSLINSGKMIPIPLSALNPSTRESICRSCPQQQTEDIAELDMNEMDELRSVEAEEDRINVVVDNLKLDMELVKTRRSMLHLKLEKKHKQVGDQRLAIQEGKFVRRFCGKPPNENCDR